MDTDEAVSFLTEDLSSVATDVREQDTSSSDEAVVIFDLITARDTQSYDGLPNSAVYIEDGMVKEYDIRLGKDASHVFEVEELRCVAESAALNAGRVDVQDVDTGGRMNKRILHVRSQQTFIHMTEFSEFLRNLYSNVKARMD